MRCVAQDGIQKLCFFAREEVGFKLRAPAVGGEEFQEEPTTAKA
jgi:hypothetical protein